MVIPNLFFIFVIQNMIKTILTPQQSAILKGKICPYCKDKSQYVDSIQIYGKSYGMIYFCKRCDAWCGVDKNNPTKSLGRLANHELRELKKKAHATFDPLWQNLLVSRTNAYRELSEYLGIEKKYTHIGMFSSKTCLRVIEFSKNYKQKKFESR